MSRLGKDIWADLEAAVHMTAARIRAADLTGVADTARAVAILADELADFAESAAAAPKVEP